MMYAMRPRSSSSLFSSLMRVIFFSSLSSSLSSWLLSSSILMSDNIIKVSPFAFSSIPSTKSIQVPPVKASKTYRCGTDVNCYNFGLKLSSHSRKSDRWDDYDSLDEKKEIEMTRTSKSTISKMKKLNSESKSATSRLPSTLFAIALALATTTAAYAYVPSDYASETVQTVIQDLKSASGKNEETFKVYENIAGIITEGKGVGGMINYKGVELERGYVADEDTTIYNPGLSLLTESEKERLVEAVIDARKDGIAKGQWSENSEYAYDFLREKLDPFHTVELSGFLKFVPYYGAFLYLAVLGVQQLLRGAFQIAYIVGAVAFFLPIALLIAAGP